MTPARVFGFRSPTTTATPDEIYDCWLAVLRLAELKVLLYIVRRTLGFHKDEDQVALSQFVEGNGIDHGTGLARQHVIAALQSLEERGLIESRKRQDGKLNLTTVYRLRWSDARSPFAGPGGSNAALPGGSNLACEKVVTQSNPQQTEEQQTVESPCAREGTPKPTTETPLTDRGNIEHFVDRECSRLRIKTKLSTGTVKMLQQSDERAVDREFFRQRLQGCLEEYTTAGKGTLGQAIFDFIQVFRDTGGEKPRPDMDSRHQRQKYAKSTPCMDQEKLTQWMKEFEEKERQQGKR